MDEIFITFWNEDSYMLKILTLVIIMRRIFTKLYKFQLTLVLKLRDISWITWVIMGVENLNILVKGKLFIILCICSICIMFLCKTSIWIVTKPQLFKICNFWVVTLLKQCVGSSTYDTLNLCTYVLSTYDTFIKF